MTEERERLVREWNAACDAFDETIPMIRNGRLTMGAFRTDADWNRWVAATAALTRAEQAHPEEAK